MITPMKQDIGFGNENSGGNRNDRMTIVPKPSSQRRDIFLNTDTADAAAADTAVSSNICSTGIAPAVAVAATADDGDGREWQNGNWCWLVPYPQSTRRRRNTGDTAVDHRQKTATTQLYSRQQNPKRNPDDTNSNKDNRVGNKYDEIEDDDNNDNDTNEDADHDNDSDEDFVLVTTPKQKTNAVSRLERAKRAAAKKNQLIWKCYGHTRRPKQNVHPSKKRIQVRQTQHEKEQRTAPSSRQRLIADVDGFHPRATKRSTSQPATEEPVVVQTDDKKNYPSVASFFSKIQR